MTRHRLGTILGTLAFAGSQCFAQCTADLTADGVLDNGDIYAFVDGFLADDLRTDLTADGIIDNGDLTAFVAAYLEGCDMATWTAQNGSESGTIALAAGGTKSYMPTQYLADPCTRTTGYLGTTTNNCSVYAVGSNASGGEVVVYLDASTTEIVVTSGGDVDFSIDYNTGENDAGGAAYPTTLLTMLNDGNGGDLDTMYDPKAAIVDAGLVIVLCSVHDYDTVGAGDRTLAASWDQQNRVAMVWKEIGDTSWNVVDDDDNAMVGALLNRWAIGRPIRPNASTLLVGFTNYTGKDASNGENRAYVSKFAGGAGAWTHSATVEILSDADAAINDDPANQHFHVVELDWDGSRLRAFVAIGDGMTENGIFECSRADLSIDDDASAKSGFTVKDATGSSSWTREGFVHGGQAPDTTDSGDYVYKVGAQPTWGVRIGDRIHFGADERAPAIYSFDVTGAAGSALDDARPEYLPHPIDWGTAAYVYLSLVGDSSNYLNDGTAVHAGLVKPTDQYISDAREDYGTRVAYHNGNGWATVANHGEANATGLGVAPGGYIVAGSASRGLVRINPGTVTAATPIESSRASTNIMQGNTTAAVTAGRATLTTTLATADADLIAASGGDDSVLTASHEVHKFIALATANAGPVVGTITMDAADLDDLINTGDVVAVRVWTKCEGANAAWYNFTANGNTAPSLSGGIPGQQPVMVSNEWTEAVLLFAVSSATDVDLQIGIQTRRIVTTPNEVASFNMSICVEGVYLNPGQRPIQRAPLSDSTADTDLVWTFTNADPIIVKGMTHPNGGSDFEAAYTGDAFLFRLYADADNYIDVTADYTNNRIAFTTTLGGTTLSEAGLLSNVEWMLGTELQFKFEVNGANLDISASYLGEPFGTAQTLNTAGSIAYNQILQDNGTNQGELMIWSVQAGSEGGQRSRNRSRQR